MHILIAPNAFKNSLSAGEAADAIALGLAASRFSGTWTTCPVGDGGDGTAGLLARHSAGVRVAARVRDPLDREIDSHFALSGDGHTAVIELADASGLKLLDGRELQPMRASTFGTGELIVRALERGVQEIVLCLGGSATIDGGSGILRALGFEFRDSQGNPLLTPASLSSLSHIDASNADSRLGACRFTVVCDVANPLLGERGAARIFGPQKGASGADVEHLERAMARYREVVLLQTATDIAHVAHGGAAGGVAAGLFGLLDAELVDGIDYVLTRIGFDAALGPADLVITGEGSIDEQTAHGKGPWGVALRARRRGVFVVGLAGQVPRIPNALLNEAFDALIPIAHRAMPVAEALSSTADDLRRTARELGNLLALGERRRTRSPVSGG
jgi:glycerate kinase